MPFNPRLDNYGDGTWTDMEASDSEASEIHPEPRANATSRSHPLIIDLPDESDEEDDPADGAKVILGRWAGDKAPTRVGREALELVDNNGTSPRPSEDLERISLLNGFISGGEGMLHEGNHSEQGELESKSHKFREQPNPTRLSCENCSIAGRLCDGIRPVCGTCASPRRSQRCRWAPTAIGQKDSYNSEQREHTRAGLSPMTVSEEVRQGIVTLPSELPSTAPDHKREPSRRESSDSHASLDDDDVPHSKDLVFSDVLPNSDDDPAGHEFQRNFDDRQNQYLDLCGSDAVSTSPSVAGDESEAGTHRPYHPRPYDEALVQLRLQGITYRAIKYRLKLNLAISTLKHRWKAVVRAGVVDRVLQAQRAVGNPGFAARPLPPMKKVMSFPCWPCKTANASCSRSIPCTRCLDRGHGAKCYYRGGRGGGCATAKNLYKETQPEVEESPKGRHRARVSTSPPMKSTSTEYRAMTTPNGTITNKTNSVHVPIITMENADPLDTRKVYCNNCTTCHQPCNAQLPSDTCKTRNRADKCSYSDRYVPAERPTTGKYTAPVDPPATDSGYSTLSPIKSAPFMKTGRNPTPSKTQDQPITRDIISDSGSENDETPADIVHEDDSDEVDTIEVGNRAGPPSVSEDAFSQLARSANGHWVLKSSKRGASESILRDSQEPSPKRQRSEPAEQSWRPSGGAKRAMRGGGSRAGTRRSSARVKRSSFATSTPDLPFPYADRDDEDEDEDFGDVRPEHVASTIREVFANMPKDIFVNILPGATGRPSRRQPTKKTGEYSMTDLAISAHEKRAAMTDLEANLMLRERADTNVFRRLMRGVRAEPHYRWEILTEEQQQELTDKKHSELQRYRDERGRSADYFAGELLKLAASCVGPQAMLQFLMQGNKESRSKIISLFEGLVEFDGAGRLRLLAGDRGDD